MTDSHFYEPAQGHGLGHDPFNAIIAPRPIGWISSRGADGSVNLAPYSFFNAFNYHPPLIGFSSVTAKDSLRNAQETGEFGAGVGVHIARHVLVDGVFDTCGAGTIMRAGGPTAYAEVGPDCRFDMRRPG